MVIKTEELLMLGVRVIKKHGATLEKGAAGMPVGDLYLTNTGLLFMPKKRWALVLVRKLTLRKKGICS